MKMNPLKAIILVVLTLAVQSGRVPAKCALQPYTVAGTVKANASDKPITNASVFLFFDENEQTLAHGALRTCPDHALTLTNGKFNITAFFDPYEGYSLLGDKCGKRPIRIEVFVIADGYLAFRGQYVVGRGVSIVERGDEHLIAIPTISLLECAK